MAQSGEKGGASHLPTRHVLEGKTRSYTLRWDLQGSVRGGGGAPIFLLVMWWKGRLAHTQAQMGPSGLSQGRGGEGLPSPYSSCGGRDDSPIHGLRWDLQGLLVRGGGGGGGGGGGSRLLTRDVVEGSTRPYTHSYSDFQGSVRGEGSHLHTRDVMW